MKKITSFLEQHIFLLYTALCIVTGAAVFLPLLAARNSLISGADGYNQYYPVYIYTGRYIRSAFGNLVHGRALPLYDFSIGFGNDILTTLNYNGFGDVFNLTAVLFPERYASVGYTLTVLLRIYAAGIAFLVWARWHAQKRMGNAAASTGTRKRRTPQTAGDSRDRTEPFYREDNLVLAACAVFYAFSGYTLAYGLVLPTFLQAAVSMPFLVIGLDRIMDGQGRGRLSALFVLTLFFQSLCGFYLLYIETIGLIVYGMVHLVCEKAGIRELGRTVLATACHYLLGIGMAGVFFLPTLMAYLNSTRSAESGLSWKDFLQLYPVGGWLRGAVGLYRGPGFQEGLGLGAVCILCLLSVWKMKIGKEQKILTAIVGVAYFFPAVGIIMNGFSYSADRWTFLLYFVFAATMTEVIPQLRSSSSVTSILLLLITAGWAVATLLDEGTDRRTWIWIAFAVLTAVLTVRVLCVWRKGRVHRISGQTQEWGTRALSILLIAGTAGMGFFNNAPHAVGGQGFYTTFKWFGLDRNIRSSAFAVHSGNAEQPFHRTDLYDSSLNASLITETPGTSSYFSISNPGAYEFLSANMVTGGVQGFSFVLQGLEGRQALEMLLSVQNYTDDVSTENIYDNPYVLPLGFTYDSYIAADNADISDPLSRNSILPHAVILADAGEEAEDPDWNRLQQIKGWERSWEEVPSDVHWMGVRDSGNSTAEDTAEPDNADPVGEFATGDEEGRLTVSFHTEKYSEDSEYYLYFRNFHYYGNGNWADVEADGKNVRLRPAGSYAGQRYDFMIKLKPETAESGTVDVILPADTEYSLGDVSVRRLDTSSYPTAYEARKQIVLENTKIGDNMVSGTIAIPQGESRLLFMSIPYDKGWSCFIDGEERNILQADDGFSAVLVPEGEHEVLFRYCTPGLKAGAAVSCAAWIIYLVIVMAQANRKKQ